MSKKNGLFTASDWMAYYEKLFRDDTPMKASPLSTDKVDRAEQAGEKSKASSKS